MSWRDRAQDWEISTVFFEEHVVQYCMYISEKSRRCEKIESARRTRAGKDLPAELPRCGRAGDNAR